MKEKRDQPSSIPQATAWAFLFTSENMLKTLRKELERYGLSDGGICQKFGITHIDELSQFVGDFSNFIRTTEELNSPIHRQKALHLLFQTIPKDIDDAAD